MANMKLGLKWNLVRWVWTGDDELRMTLSSHQSYVAAAAALLVARAELRGTSLGVRSRHEVVRVEVQS
jgi:hypothetical protein